MQRQERERFLAQLAPQRYALREYRHEGLVAHALESVSDLKEEGTAMRHCLRMPFFPGEPRLEQFAEGALRYFSIREAEQGERVATLEIERGDDAGTWVVGECQGPSNQPVTMQVLGFARRLAEAYGAANDPSAGMDARTEAA